MAMLADTTFAPRSRSTGFLGSLFAALGSLAAAHDAARTYAALDALSDAELAARGMARSDIAAAAARVLDRR